MTWIVWIFGGKAYAACEMHVIFVFVVLGTYFFSGWTLNRFSPENLHNYRYVQCVQYVNKCGTRVTIANNICLKIYQNINI